MQQAQNKSLLLFILFSLPDAKDAVKQEAPKEAENHIGPGVPGIQLHKLGSVQVEILVQSGREKTSLLKPEKPLMAAPRKKRVT